MPTKKRIMKTSVFILLTIIATNIFCQNNSVSAIETEKLLYSYYPDNKTLHQKVKVFYDSLAACRDTTTIDWLFKEQINLSSLLARDFDPYNPLIPEYSIQQLLKDLNKSLLGFEFDQTYSGDFHLLVYPDIKFILEYARKKLMRGEPNETSMKIEKAFEIFFDVWGPVKYDYTAYCYDICCDCAQESALGSGLHSKVLTAITIYTAHSNLFSEAIDEIKEGLKYDVLNTYAFSSPKKAILAEFAIVKPLLDLSEEEALIYEKKRIYLEETPEESLHNYGR